MTYTPYYQRTREYEGSEAFPGYVITEQFFRITGHNLLIEHRTYPTGAQWNSWEIKELGDRGWQRVIELYENDGVTEAQVHEMIEHMFGPFPLRVVKDDSAFKLFADLMEAKR